MMYKYKFNDEEYSVEINETDEKDVFEVIDLYDGDANPNFMTKDEIELAYQLVL